MKQFYKCELCNNEEYQKIYEVGIFSSKMNVASCKKCGLICLNPRWDEEDYAGYYKNLYYSNYLKKPANSIEDNNDNKRNSRGEQIYNCCKNYVDINDRILEIGAGAGDNITYLNKKGFSGLSCIEVDKLCCDKISESYPNISVYNSTLMKFKKDYPGNKFFKLIILSHVLEHFVNPDAALKIIRSFLYKDAYLYILVPDIFAFEKPYSGFTVPHTHYFSQATLSSILRKNGFKIIKYPEHNNDEMAILAQNTEDVPEIYKNEYQFAVQKVKQKYTLQDFSRRMIKRCIELIFTEKMYKSVLSIYNK